MGLSPKNLITSQKREALKFPRLFVALTAAISWICMAIPAHSQDVAFTQTSLHPITANPALTGTEGRYRASLGHRAQWRSIGVDFITRTAAFDMRIGGNKNGGGLGVGLMLFTDRAGDPAFTTTQFNLSLAYTLAINDNSKISAGINLAYDQRSVQAGAGQWASQYNGVRFDPSMASGEAFGNERLSAAHAGMGIAYHYDKNRGSRNKGKELSLSLGAAIVQLGQLEVTQANSIRHDFNERLVVFGNAGIDVGEGGFGLEPMLMYVNQGDYDLIMVGSYFRYAVLEGGSSFAGNTKPLHAAVGSFVRVGEAVSAALRVDWGDYTLGLCYDFSTSSVTTAIPRMGAWELALVWRKD